MTRPEQQTGVSRSEDPAADDALATDSRDRAVRALLRYGPLRRLWSAQLTAGVGDALALLVLLLLTFQAAVQTPSLGGEPVFGGGYRGVALAVAAVLGVRLLATFLFGAVLLGPLSALTASGGALDRRWTMITSDALRAVALILAPLWIEWAPQQAFVLLLITVFLTGVAERVWTITRDSTAPALLPAAPPEGAAVRPLPDHHGALRRLWIRTGFAVLPIAAAALVVVSLISDLLGFGIEWFQTHQAALAGYAAAGLFAASLAHLVLATLPDSETPRPRSPLEGLRRPRTGDGRAHEGAAEKRSPERGRTGAMSWLVIGCAAVAGAVAAAVALAALFAADLSGGPVSVGLLVLALAGGTAAGTRLAPLTLPALSRNRLFALAIAVTGVALLAAGLTLDTATVVFLTLIAGLSAGVAAHSGHTLLDQEVEETRRERTTEHLRAVVRLTIALCALAAPVLAAFIGPHRVVNGDVVFQRGGAAFTLMLVGALLLPVAALVLGRMDDRRGVTLRRDLREAFGGGEPEAGPAASGFFLVVEGGDGAGKSTQVEALAEWIRAKGHEVVVTREPGATPIGKRLRSILLDVSSGGVSDRAEALLYAADRAEHVDTVVRPALERGAVVISDRYTDSSVAYQGAGRELSPTEIARISRWATGGLVPHLTVLLDISPQTARERFTEAPDRLESEPDEFHQRVRAGFLTLAAADPARYLVIDAAQEPEAATTVVRHRLDQMLPLSEAEITAREEARKAAEEEARRRAEEEAARKAEEERLERERQERLEKLRVEEEERKRREAELERQREEARRIEEARQRAEEARLRAEEERERREAEEKARREEEERQRRQAEEEERLRAQAEERRLEKQRKAEEALLRAEESRSAEASPPPRRSVEPGTDTEDTVRLPKVEAQAGSGSSADTEETTQLPRHERGEVGSEEETTAMPVVGPEDDQTAAMPTVAHQPPGPAPAGESDSDRTREMPQYSDEDEQPARPRPQWAEETPMDDMPTLADELLGPREEHDEDHSTNDGRRR